MSSAEQPMAKQRFCCTSLLAISWVGGGVAAAATTNYPVTQSTAPLIIDGNLDESFWHLIPVQVLVSAETGVPAELGGDSRVALRGSELVLAANCPEPGGKVLARSIGHNPIWEKDSYGSPAVEDRMEYRLKYQVPGGVERNLSLAVNPWGAYRIEQDGEPVPVNIQLAAQVTVKGWSSEAVLPLDMLNLDRSAGTPAISLHVERIRSRRPLAPEFHWSWPGPRADANLVLPAFASMATGLAAPDYRAPAFGNNEPPLEVGRVLAVPPIVPEWDDPAWQGVRAFTLPQNDPIPRAPNYPTEVKWMHDGHTLALLVHVIEPEPVVARAGGRDSGVMRDDHVAIHLATSGSAFLQIAFSSVGAIWDARGIGPHMGQPQASWNLPVQVQTNIRYGAWTARINIPLLECATALGESRIPSRWRVLIERYRAERPGEASEISTLPVVGSSTFFGPLRYRRMVLENVIPSQVRLPESPYPQRPRGGLAGELAALDSHVWDPLYRRYNAVRTMVERHQEKRAHQAILAERRAWDGVKTLDDWKRYRETRLQSLREVVGKYPTERPPLDVRVSMRYDGDGYHRENLAYQSRSGFYVSANLYLPAELHPPIPAIVIQHSYHYPKTQGELQDMGMLWARTGCAVLVIERLGFGERVETTPWFRQATISWFTFSKQLNLVGESHEGWMAWDLIRAVDLLYARPDIDRERIILLGSVAGGDEPAAVAAALDERISAVIPINYDRGHIQGEDEDLFGQITRQLTTSFIVSSVAPRRYVRAFEFGWEGAEEPDFPDVWVSGWLRAQKVWGLYGAVQNLASSQGYGLIRLSMERISHCFSAGPQQRKELYPILQRWFKIPLPLERDLNILPDSELGTNRDPEGSLRQEAQRRRPEPELLSITPAMSSELRRKPLHQIAHEMGLEELQVARAKRASLSAAEKRVQLQEALATVLGDIEPSHSPRAEIVWTRSLSGSQVEAVALEVEDGISVPLFMIRPVSVDHPPVVIGVSQQGKERFLSDRSEAIAKLVRDGVAVCLPDLRGTGETLPDADRSDQGHALREFSLGSTLLGARLKDLRTVITYLRDRTDIGGRRIGIWGDAFVPANSRDLFLDELQWEAGPQIQYHAEPLGAHLALLAALYEEDVRAVVAHRGLAGYISVLENAFAYVPTDIIVSGILKIGDIPDIIAGLSPRPVTLAGCVNGRNVQLTADELDHALVPAREQYRNSGELIIRSEPAESDVTSWLVARLK
jgi:dienelactone hydrolase